MSLTPDYGSTHVPDDEADALLPSVRELVSCTVASVVNIWVWAGVFRRLETNVGVAPEQIAVELHSALVTIRYRWRHTADWSAHQLGIAAHAETDRIHPFIDGNGRATRLLADLVYAADQEDGALRLYDWKLDKRRYIDLLRQDDRCRDPSDLAAFVGTKSLGQ